MYFRSVSRAVQNLVQPDVLQSQAVDVRMELDLRIGRFENGVVSFKTIFKYRHGTMQSTQSIHGFHCNHVQQKGNWLTQLAGQMF